MANYKMLSASESISADAFWLQLSYKKCTMKMHHVNLVTNRECNKWCKNYLNGSS